MSVLVMYSLYIFVITVFINGWLHFFLGGEEEWYLIIPTHLCNYGTSNIENTWIFLLPQALWKKIERIKTYLKS